MRDRKPSDAEKRGTESGTHTDTGESGMKRALAKARWLIESGKYIAGIQWAKYKQQRAECRERRLNKPEPEQAQGGERKLLWGLITKKPAGENPIACQDPKDEETLAAGAADITPINSGAGPAETGIPTGMPGHETAADCIQTDGPVPSPLTEAGRGLGAEPKQKKAKSFEIGGWRYSIKRLVLVSLAILLAVGIGLAGQFSYIVFARPQAAFTQPTPIPQDLETPEPDAFIDEYMNGYTDTETPEEPTPTPDPYAEVAAQAQPDFSKDIVNVLLIGADYAEEREDWHRYNSDVMIILAMNFKENKADLISVPRDTYAKIYKTSGHYKLNASMYFGGGFDKNGPEYVMRSVEYVLGNKVPIPYYVGVDMPALKDLVDALGGVDYNVDVRIELNGRVIEPGLRHLDGQMVVDYCRARKGIDNDLGRVERQRNILLALFKKMRDTQSLAKLPDILKAMEGKVHTNLSFQQICAMVVFGAGLGDEKIKMQTLAGDFHLVFNSKFVVLDQQAKVNLVREIFGVTIKPDNTYGYTAAAREWQTMMAGQYITKVKKVLDKDGKLPPEQQKVSPEQRALLEGDISATKAAISSRNTSKISNAKDKLQADADFVVAACGLPKIDWDVDQNPGKKIKY